eukprot:632951-Amphidinium_carterae.5
MADYKHVCLRGGAPPITYITRTAAPCLDASLEVKDRYAQRRRSLDRTTTKKTNHSRARIKEYDHRARGALAPICQEGPTSILP